ncbi:MAG TPA: hypothetical protein VGT79_04195 [Xanthomonadaceae bacterium]|nr:hypothetical protein [Xanthomonadaceae bacterium]
MSKQIKARPMNRPTDVRTGARQVLLAGIGAASLLRKNAGKSWAEATAIAGRMPEATSILIEGLGERSQAFRDELIVRAKAATTNLVADVESRLQPLLRKFGETTVGLGIVVSRQGKRGAAKTARKPVKTVAKRKARKAA